MGENPKDLRRCNLMLPGDLYDELKEEAERKHVSLSELIRKFMKIGLILVRTEDVPDAAIIIREGPKDGSGVREREIIIC